VKQPRLTLADDFLDALPCADQRVRSTRELSARSGLSGSIVFLDELDTDNLNEVTALLRERFANSHVIDAMSFVLDMPDQRNEIAKTITPLITRGVVERVQAPDGALRCHNLLKSFGTDTRVDELSSCRNHLRRLEQRGAGSRRSHKFRTTWRASPRPGGALSFLNSIANGSPS
jgi:hypothetical protein